MAKGRAIIAFSLILLCLTASSAVYLYQVKAQYQGNIMINSDGSVNPSSAPIKKVGNTYFLTSDIVSTITIQKSNFIFDGNGYRIIGNTTYVENGSTTLGQPFYGFHLNYVQNVTIENVVITGIPEGIDLENTSNVMVTNVTISNQVSSMTVGYPSAAIAINDGVSNTIQKSTFSNDNIGIDLESFNHAPCFDNLIIANNFTDCNTVFLLYYSSNNTIYHNNFISSGSDGLVDDLGYAYGVASIEVWDDGFPAGGNYWGYQTGKEIGNMGISDTPYEVNALENTYPHNVDWYPLIKPFNSAFLSNYEQEVTPPNVSVSSPSNETYRMTNVSLAFSIDKPFNWVGYSLDEQSNVTLNGNTTISNIAYGSHSITVYSNSTFGVIGASKTIDFTVAKSEPFTYMTVSVVSAIVIAVVIGLAVALLYYRRRHRKTAKEIM